MRTYAQVCNQNNLNIQSIDFYDINGEPFDPDAEFEPGTNVDGQIFVTFGGSSSNAYSLYFSYDIYINGAFSENVVLCLFAGQNVIKETAQYINDFTVSWGDRIEFRNIFMRWYTNSGNPSCPTAEGSNAQCYSNPEGFVVNTPYISLPVVWHDIVADIDQDGEWVSINWGTMHEWETSHFELERSVDGIENFTKIAEIKSAGWSSQVTQYHYTDNQIPYITGRNYYRIKQVDLDGSFGYSKTLSVWLEKLAQDVTSWHVYPNPCTNNSLKLKLIDSDNYNGEPVHLAIISNLNLFYYTLEGNIDFFETELSSLIQDLPNGMLIMRVSWGNQSESIKIIKK